MPTFFPGFISQSIPSSEGISIHTLTGPITGPPLLLIHGFPQTHHIWHFVTPHLVDKYTIVLVDLRGYGLSSKPRASADGGHVEYSKSVMGEDCLAVMKTLGYPQFSILAHDRGARVGHQLAINHPEAITKLMVLDILPTLTMYELGKQTWYQKYWHWQFLSQASPFPESAILSDPSLFAEKFLGVAGVGGKDVVFHEDVKSIYEDMLRDEETVHGMCEDYRAGSSIDLEEQRRDRRAGRKIRCEVFVVWGGKGAVEIEFEDVLGLWGEVCAGGVEGCSVDGGHYVPEECHGELVELVRGFF
ncbi:hypothetical protein SBOR_9810 [Sclerotinia borealis F-4128]|uniref:AB hydrolase-1 domain-containing protein n=1 Tax=Sclerotinia borealis (strain F-4128) TaxID=1432307 RepID=W9C4I8_SCLBF|nr:hypothetical protein SBOR_9810 [Sclerotinia borealis F-4128]